MPFPGFWKVWLPVVFTCLVVSGLLAAFVAPSFVLAGPLAAMVAFVWLWGPGGRMRRRDQESSD